MAILGKTGYAVDTTLVTGVSATNTTAYLASFVNWPDGSSSRFVITLDSGTPLEEQVLCSKQINGVVTILTRGYQGTVAVSHAAGVKVSANNFETTIATPTVTNSPTYQDLTLTGHLRESATDNIVASATQTQAGATALTTDMNRVVTVALAGNAVRLLPSSSGLTINVTNAHATNAVSVFPANGDQIETGGVNAFFSVAAAKTVTFVCHTAGQWHKQLSA